MTAVETITEPVVEPAETEGKPTARRYSGVVVVVVALLGIVAGAAAVGFLPHAKPAAVPQVRINVGVRPYPAQATASWKGTDGKIHQIDVWAGEPVTAPAVEVTVAVARYNGGDAGCDLYINGHVEDVAVTAPQDQAVTCSWTSTERP